jgi:hypothetical protein
MVRKFRKIKECLMWWGTTFGSLLYIGFISHSFSFLFLFILSFYVCDSKKIYVCEVKKRSYTCVNKYNGFWLKVVSQLFFCVLP